MVQVRSQRQVGVGHCPDRFGLKRQAEHGHRAGRGIEGRELDFAGRVGHRVDDGCAPHNVVLPGRREQFRHPGDGGQQVLQRHRMGDFEPAVINDKPAVDVVFRNARLVPVVRCQDLHSPGQFGRPGVLGFDAELGKRHGHFHRAIPQRTAAAPARLGKRPRAAVDLAGRLRTDARVVQKQREDIARVVPPVGELVLIVHEVPRGEFRDVFRLDRIGPVPVVAAPDVVDGPVRQQPVAEPRPAGIAGLDNLAVCPAVAEADQLVEEVEEKDHAAGLLVVLPPRGFRIGVTAPGGFSLAAISLGGQQVAPMLARLEPLRIAGKLVGTQQAQPHLGHDVQLNHTRRIALAVRFAHGRHADEKPGPGVIGRRQAVVQQGVGLPGEVGDRRRIAAVAIVIHQARKDVGRPLAQVAVVPVLDRYRRDRAVGIDLPVPVEDVVRSGAGGLGRGDPGITLERLRGDPQAEIARPVLAAIPWPDHSVLIVDRRVSVVALLDGRRRRDSGGAQVHNAGKTHATPQPRFHGETSCEIYALAQACPATDR